MERKMDKDIRIEKVEVRQPCILNISWRGKRAKDAVQMIGWIATGGEILAPLKNPEVFAQAHVADHGASVAWDDGDLSIDAFHLKKLAEEQKPFDSEEAVKWQKRVGLSNNEVADLIQIGLSTWNDYKAGKPIPAVVGILLRAIERDPLLLQAHFKPRVAGRPRKVARQ
jgi:hypothetical protein